MLIMFTWGCNKDRLGFPIHGRWRLTDSLPRLLQWGGGFSVRIFATLSFRYLGQSAFKCLM